MGELGLPELLVIFGIALLIFGPRKIGELGKSLGEGIRGFKSAISGEPKKEPPAEEPKPEVKPEPQATSADKQS